MAIPRKVLDRLTEIGGATGGVAELMRHEGDPQCFSECDGNFSGMQCPFKASLRECCGLVSCEMHHEHQPTTEAQHMDAAFQVHRLTEDGMSKAKVIAESFNELLAKLSAVVPEGRELAIVKTKLEEASFFAKKGMAQQNGTPE